jgi:hypothetical protein
MIKNNNLKLTSVKVVKELYTEFKEDDTSPLTLQKLVNRCLYLYLKDPDFRKGINKITNLKEEYNNKTL